MFANMPGNKIPQLSALSLNLPQGKPTKRILAINAWQFSLDKAVNQRQYCRRLTNNSLQQLDLHISSIKA
jgi:hypothetical protein